MLVGSALVAAGALVRLPMLLAESDGSTTAMVLGLGLGVMIAVAVFGWYGRRTRRQLAKVSAARPFAQVVLGMTTPELLTEARRLGVSTRRISATGGEHAVLAVLPDGVEAWFRGDHAPRWRVDRTAGTSVRVEEVRIQLGTFEQVRVADDRTAVEVVPVDPRVSRLLSRAARRRQVDCLLNALGVQAGHRGSSGSDRQSELPI